MPQSTFALHTPFFLFAFALATSLGAQTKPVSTEDPVVELEKFIVTESGFHTAGNVLPTSRPVSSVFGPEQSILDLPRAVTVLTPELMQRFDIQGLADLNRLGAGTQAANFFGIAGTPYLRGAKAGTFFNGMLRAFQRNEMPVSFGSLEALDLEKGPAPSHFGATLEGGYINCIPKAPFFDKPRGSLTFTVGSYNTARAQLDYGGPTLLLGKPAAWRVSLSEQDAGSYWRNVDNDYTSLYAALKAMPGHDLTLFTGVEYYDFHSNENPGWNRVTQNLIDRGEYIIGEPQNITSPAWGGTADRNLITFPGSVIGQPANFRALIVPTAIAEARLTPGQLALLEDRRGTDGGYRYTQAYFTAGNHALTANINGSTVLSDPHDYADSTDFLWFFDLVNRRQTDRTLTWKSYVEWLETDKHSSYGYAIASEQLVVENKVFVEQQLPALARTTLTAGLSHRYSYGWSVQDFSAEPFNRRDISLPTISPNSIVRAGSDLGADGLNLWSPFLGANTESDLYQTAAFAYAQTRWHDRFSTILSARGEHASFSADMPHEVDRATPAIRASTQRNGKLDHGSVAISGNWRVAGQTHLYATMQHGTSLQPAQGGTVNSKSNFAGARLLEVGAKTALLDGKLFASLAAYRWRNSRFNDLENRAERLRGRGVEFELTWAPSRSFSVIAAAGDQRVYRLDPLAFRAIAPTEANVALEAGSFYAGTTPTPALNPRLIYPGTPEKQAKLDFAWQPHASWTFNIGTVWSERTYHNFEHTLVLPASLVWHAGIRWQLRRLELHLVGENLTNEDYFIGADPYFSHNNLVTKAPAASAKLTARWSF